VNTNLGIEELDRSNISIYPNPTANQLYIKANSQIESIILYDLLGKKVVETAPLAKNAELNIASLKTGMYLAIISSEGKKTVRKIVKE
jgi:hypothetical protein